MVKAQRASRIQGTRFYERRGMNIERPRRVSYFKVNLENRPGALLKIMTELKAKNIGLAGLWGFATQGEKAELYVLPKNAERLRNFWKGSGFLADEGTGFWLKGADRTGALNSNLEALATAGVNIEAIDAIAVGGRFGSFIRVGSADIEKAAEALGAK